MAPKRRSTSTIGASTSSATVKSGKAVWSDDEVRIITQAKIDNVPWTELSVKLSGRSEQDYNNKLAELNRPQQTQEETQKLKEGKGQNVTWKHIAASLARRNYQDCGDKYEELVRIGQVQEPDRIQASEAVEESPATLRFHWEPEEDVALYQAVEDGLSWDEISAERMTHRSVKACRLRYNRVRDVTTGKSTEDSKKLLATGVLQMAHYQRKTQPRPQRNMIDAIAAIGGADVDGETDTGETVTSRRGAPTVPALPPRTPLLDAVPSSDTNEIDETARDVMPATYIKPDCSTQAAQNGNLSHTTGDQSKSVETIDISDSELEEDRAWAKEEARLKRKLERAPERARKRQERERIRSDLLTQIKAV